MNEHPRSRLDDLIHQPVRLSIVAALASARELEFGFVRDAVQVSDSLLSRYMGQLEEAGYVAVRKGYVGKRPRTWLSLTDAGREAYTAHIEALRAIAGDALTHPERIQLGTRPATAT
jgi:DNA-binding MarR family transcriptional regulator